MVQATSIVMQVAGGVVLLATAVALVSAARERGRQAPAPSRLARAQSAAMAVAAVGLGAWGLTAWEVAFVAWVGGTLAAVVIAAARGRRGEPQFAPAAIDAALHAELADLLREGRTIEAIRLTKDRTGSGLVPAKLAVDRVAEAEGLEARV